MPKDKFLVEIINEFGIKSRKKYPVDENSVIIKPAKKGRKGGPPYKASFSRTCILNYKVGIGPLKRLKQKLMLIEGSDKCIDFKNGKIPKLDRETLKRLANAEVYHKAGTVSQKLQVPTFVYVMLVFIILLQFIGLMLASGNVTIG